MEGFAIRVFILVVAVIEFATSVSANVVFQVHHKFPVENRSLSACTAHDSFRHRRILAADLPLGGDSSPSSAGLYYTKIQIGNPPRDYHVHVDTGSDILWVNCGGCFKCPNTSDLGVPLSLYDPKQSLSSQIVTCEQDFCTTTLDPTSHVCIIGNRCTYLVRYADGGSTAGYVVRDTVQLDRISGNLQTTNMNGSIMFGCGSKQLGRLGETKQALDGILGLGQSNSSIISQLASSKKVKKMFSHCLSGSKGGIFAIGEVVHPKVNSTPMLPNKHHFNIELKAIQVGDEFVNLPTYMFNTAAKRGTIIDSGTTLAYLPEPVYSELMEKVMAAQPNPDVHLTDHKFKCYSSLSNMDESFPIVTFHFANALKLKVYPHQYIFKTQLNHWCIGFLSSCMQSRETSAVLLGDIIMTDRLVTYNMEDQSIGWTDYDCSSSIKVKDEESGMVYEVGAHDISRVGLRGGSSRANVSVFVLLVFIIATKIVMY